MNADLKDTLTGQAPQVKLIVLVTVAQPPLSIPTPALADQCSSSILSESTLAGDSMDSDSPLTKIPYHATFLHWRAIRELVERTLLLVELGRMEGMSL